MSGKRITLFCNTLPYPDHNGARADIWRRIRTLHEEGSALQLICWSKERPPEPATDIIKNYCDELIILPIVPSFGKKIRKLFLALGYPFLPAEILAYTDRNALADLVRSFAPDFLWLESYTPALPALEVAERLSLPLCYRSHNIEYLYEKEITASMKPLSPREGLYRFLVEKGLENFECGLLEKSDKVFDISLDDRAFWKKRFPDLNIAWLPPRLDTEAGEKLRKKTMDFLFVGNLFSPNNLLALKWLLDQVMPRILSRLPEARLCIAGSRPAPEFRSFLSRYSFADLISDFESTSELLGKSRVVLNPALKGSGVTIKTIDALRSGTPWVGTRQAVQGIPEKLRILLQAVDHPGEFADKAVMFYQKPELYPSEDIHRYAHDYFDRLPARMLHRLSKGR